MTKHIAVLGLLLTAALAFNFTAAEQGVENTIRQSLSRVMSVTGIDQINPTPMDGISEVLAGINVFYVSNDGKYLIQGKLIELESRKNLTEERLGTVRRKMISKVDKASMIIFPAKKESHTITVFTDIDCGYCRKLHSEIASYNARGITVRYLSFPRAGPNSPSFNRAASVWCSEDRNDALTRAKAGENVPARKCDNPVSEHYNLGVAMGVRGTPAILLESGALMPGYMPANKLVRELDRKRKEKS